MKLTSVFQIILIFLVILILGIFYYIFFVSNQASLNSVQNTDEKKFDGINKEIKNQLINIEYNSSDENGNTFYINAEKAIVETDNLDDNNVSLEGVVSIINLKEKGIINVYSKSALYNKINNNTYFFNKVKVEYLDNIIYSENLDIIFTDKTSKAYNNVILNNNKLNLTTDKIIIDMLTGDIKLEMDDNLKKVKLITDYEFAN